MRLIRGSARVHTRVMDMRKSQARADGSWTAPHAARAPVSWKVPARAELEARQARQPSAATLGRQRAGLVGLVQLLARRAAREACEPSGGGETGQNT